MGYYTKLGFTVYEGDVNVNILILDKIRENIEKLNGILQKRGEITTEFYSTYPDNIIT